MWPSRPCWRPRRPGPQSTSSGSGQIDVPLTGEDTTRLARWAAEWGVTPNTLVQGAWAMVLAQLTGREDVLFGATVAGRPSGLPGADTMIGLFINTVPVRVRCTPADPGPGGARPAPGRRRGCWTITIWGLPTSSERPG